MARIANFDI
jgi:hypothetical protein